MAKAIMAWRECAVKIGKTGAGDEMSASLTSIGIVKDKASSLEPTTGDALEAKSSGGHTVAKEYNEGGYTFKTRIIEPTNELEVLLGIAEAEASNETKVKTHIVEGNFSLEVEPINVGAKGIRAPKTNVVYSPGWSEEEGNYADVEFEILLGDAGYWYKRFTKQASVD